MNLDLLQFTVHSLCHIVFVYAETDGSNYSSAIHKTGKSVCLYLVNHSLQNAVQQPA